MAMVVDTNVHLLAVDGSGQPVPPPTGSVPTWWRGATAEEVRDHMRQAGVDRSLVVATGAYDDSYVIASAQRYPESFTAIGKLDVLAPDAAERLRRLWETPSVGGIRFEPRSEDLDAAEWLDSPQVRGVWALADSQRIPVSLGAVRRLDQLSPLRRVLERFPSLIVVLRRMVQPPLEDGPPHAQMADLFALAGFPHVYSTFSHLNLPEAEPGRSASRAFFEAFLEKFGPQRLMWASFFPAYRASAIAPIKGLLDEVREQLSFLPAEDLDWLFGEAAARLYGLPTPARAGRDR